MTINDLLNWTEAAYSSADDVQGLAAELSDLIKFDEEHETEFISDAKKWCKVYERLGAAIQRLSNAYTELETVYNNLLSVPEP